MRSAAICLLLTSFGFGTVVAASDASAQVPQISSTDPAPVPTYPDTTSGLQKLVEDTFRADKKNDTATYNALISSLARQVPDDWFHDTFGDEGDAIFKEYPGAGPRLVSELQAFFTKVRNEKFTQVTAKKHEASCDDNSGELIYPVMVMRQNPVPLYELRFLQGEKFYRLWAFAYVDGGFRFVGNLRPPEYFPEKPARRSSAENKPSGSDEPDRRVRMGGTVVAAKLLHQVQPEYPEIAKREHLQGTVKLHAIIAQDGTVRMLRVLTGYCSLSEAAVKAVRQWRYTPTLLEGKPVDVDTTIQVVFSLNR